MGLIIHIAILAFVGFVVLAVVVFLVIDMFERVDYMKEKYPRLQTILERRSALAGLLVVSIFLVVGDAADVVTPLRRNFRLG